MLNILFTHFTAMYKYFKFYSKIKFYRQNAMICLGAILKSIYTSPSQLLVNCGYPRLSSNKHRVFSKKANGKFDVYITRPDIDPIGIELIKAKHNVTVWKTPDVVPRDELLKQIKGKHALYCALTDKINAEVLDAAGPQLKCVATISVGYDHIDVAECKKRKIRVGYTPDVLTDATAELTVALCLATSRRLIEANKEVYNGGWRSWAPMWMCGQGLKCARVGLFGFGRIGKEVASRIKPFKPAIITYTSKNPVPSEKEFIFVSFDEMLCESDFIISCTALTPETKEIFNASAFNKMKRNAIFINSSRGGVVHQPSLVEALKENRIQAAGLDVTTPEPLPLDDPILCLNNIVILPHIGSADVNTRIEMARITALNILAALDGKKMDSEVLV